MVRVARLDGFGKILKKIIRKVFMDRKNFGFLGWMIDESHLNSAGGYVGGRILMLLRFLDD